MLRPVYFREAIKTAIKRVRRDNSKELLNRADSALSQVKRLHKKTNESE